MFRRIRVAPTLALAVLLAVLVVAVYAAGPYPALDTQATARVVNDDATSTAAYHAADTQTAAAQPTATNTPVPSTATPVPAGWWNPPVVQSWYWQLQGTVPTNRTEGVYDIDGFDTSAATVATLHAAGKHAVCYLSVGTWENWRSDANQFPTSVLGNNNGWPGEKWLDIRADSIKPIMQARLEMCRTKGFDAVEPDNVDGYQNGTGFNLSPSDQSAYNLWIAGQAHQRGLAVFLKNDTDQVAALAPSFDGGIVEECARYNECGMYQPHLAAGHPVFAAEYSGTVSTRCATLTAANFNGAYTKTNLDGSSWTDCR